MHLNYWSPTLANQYQLKGFLKKTTHDLNHGAVHCKWSTWWRVLDRVMCFLIVTWLVNSDSECQQTNVQDKYRNIIYIILYVYEYVYIYIHRCLCYHPNPINLDHIKMAPLRHHDITSGHGDHAPGRMPAPCHSPGLPWALGLFPRSRRHLHLERMEMARSSKTAGSSTSGDMLVRLQIPFDKLTQLLKMAICSWFTHLKWWFSKAMLVYQRVVVRLGEFGSSMQTSKGMCSTHDNYGNHTFTSLAV